jgi:lipid-A-disaccharide synthase
MRDTSENKRANSANRSDLNNSTAADCRLPAADCSLMIVAGEASGDRHGAALVSALKRLYPQTRFEFFGSGGEEMRAAGVETLVDAREVAIIGIPEILRAMGKLYRAYRQLVEAARERRPEAVVLIDWPDFNMRLAKRLKRDGLKIIYYISPQVWAWRKYRVRALGRDVTRMMVILPFEEEFYKGRGVEVEYVGHPLVETVRATRSREDFFSKHGFDCGRPLVALLPGSRRKEIHYHLPLMLDAATRLGYSEFQNGAGGDFAKPQFVLPLASTADRDQVKEIISRRGASFDLKVVEQETYDALAHSDIAVVASGTATVEAALLGTPMVIIYRASELNWRLIRPLIQLDTFGMVNLIAGRRIAPELIQHDATGERIAREVERILSSREIIARMREGLVEVRDKLAARGGPGAEHAARAVMRVIGFTEAHSQL